MSNRGCGGLLGCFRPRRGIELRFPVSHFLHKLPEDAADAFCREWSSFCKVLSLLYYLFFPARMAGDHFIVAWGQVNTLPPSLFFVDTGLAGAGVNLAESVIKKANIKLQYDRATQGVGGAGKFKSIPYTVPELFLGDIKEGEVAGVFDGPLSVENVLGFHVAAVIGHEFFRRYAVTFDFTGMRIILN